VENISWLKSVPFVAVPVYPSMLSTMCLLIIHLHAPYATCCGETVSIILAQRAQAKTYQRAIDRHRQLEATTEKVRELSLALLEQTTKGVAKRERKQ